MKRPVIIHVLESLGAGTLTSCSQICNLMAAEEADVHVIYSPLREETPENMHDFFDERVTLHRIDMLREVSLIGDLKSLCGIFKLLLCIKPDVVHAHCSKAGVLARLAAVFIPRIKVFYSPRGFSFLQEDLSKKKRKFYWLIEKLFASLKGTIIACSRSELDYALKLSANSILVENAIDSKKLPEYNFKSNPDVVHVVTLGRVSYQKNPQLFSNVAQKVMGFDERFVFTWIGGGDEELSKILRDSGVRVTGWLDRPDALAVLMKGDIYLQTSLWEGMPLSVIEASMIGIPCVVTNVIGNRDIVKHGETGLICDDLTELSDSIIDIGKDDAYRLALSTQSKKDTSYRFSMARLRQDYLHIYFGGE